MTKSSPARIHRRNIRKLAKAEAERIGPAEARRKLAEWAARGGDIELLCKLVNRPIDKGRLVREALDGRR